MSDKLKHDELTEIAQHVEYVLNRLVTPNGEALPGAAFTAYRLARARNLLVAAGADSMLVLAGPVEAFCEGVKS